MGAGAGMAHGLLLEKRERPVVVHALPAKYAAVSVVRVFAETHVGCNVQIRVSTSQVPDCKLNDSSIVQAVAALGVLVFRDAEKDNRANAHLDESIHGFVQSIDRMVIHAGHRRDFRQYLLARDHKQRHHKVVGVQPGLANQAPDGL